jgi:hypothetical protein
MHFVFSVFAMKKNAGSITEIFISLSGSNKRLYWKLRYSYSYCDHFWSTDSRGGRG